MPECHVSVHLRFSLFSTERSAKPVEKKLAKTRSQSVIQEPDRNEDELKANSETLLHKSFQQELPFSCSSAFKRLNYRTVGSIYRLRLSNIAAITETLFALTKKNGL